tara:strand:+ start:154 stop:480 length:327 start_codon:yes stop_codon:yes gene_type:complete
MTKFIRIQDDFRVRVKYDKTFKHYNLRLQKKFFCFWINTEWFVDIKEGFWGEEGSVRNPLTLDYMQGGSLESYKKGTMNFNKRAKKLCKDYLKEQSKQAHNKKVLADL